MLQDFRYAIRQLRRSPGFTTVAAITLALGIGAITTVFTWTNAVYFNPWPRVGDARQIRTLSASVHGDGGYTLHYSQLQYLREHDRAFTELTAHEMFPVDLASQGARPERYWAGIVASNYFQFLRVQPILGRGFEPGDDRAYGSRPEAVISYGLWRSRFRGDSGIIGRSIEINRHPVTIVGVEPPDFVGIYGGLAQTLWVPFSELPALTDGKPDPLITGNFGLEVAARLRPGVSDSEAAAELHTLAHQFASQQNSTYYTGWDLLLSDAAHMSRGMFGSISELVPLLLGAAGLLLLLVCTNVAGLLVQRSSRRARELAIRTSLGATRGRLTRQLLAEAACIALLAGVMGWAASLLLARSMYVLMPALGMPIVLNLHPDARVLAFAISITAMVVLACGLMPARQMLRRSQLDALHEGTMSVVGSRSQWRRNALLSAQLGICFVVLVAGGLLGRTLWNVVHRDPGFSTSNTLTASLDLARAGYSQPRAIAFQRALLDRLRNLPGVESASLTSYVPMGLSGGGNVRDVAVDGYTPAKSESMSIVTDSVAPDFFQTMRIPLLQGREFSDRDSAESPCVAVINQSMARKYWPRGNSVGGHLEVSKKSCEVVGITRNIIYRNAAWDTADPVLYLSLFQDYQGVVNLVVRSKASAYSVLSGLDNAVGSLDSTLPVNDVMALNEHVQTSYADQKVPAELIGVYGICSLLIAMLGVYAAMGYSVVERTREFAVRVALGANRRNIRVIVLRQAGEVALGGMLVGATGAFFAVRLLKSALFGVSAFDPTSALGAAAVLIATAILAAVVPARRAASIEPMQALRSE